MAYAKLKQLAVDLIDDFSDLDIKIGYFPPPGEAAKYNAKSKLDAVQITAPVRSVMPPRVNKVLAKAYGGDWSDVSAFETVKVTTMGDFIKLCAKHAGETLPQGEPT